MMIESLSGCGDGCEQRLSVNTLIERFATLPHPATCGRAPSLYCRSTSARENVQVHRADYPGRFPAKYGSFT
jgi:hypothetical protein